MKIYQENYYWKYKFRYNLLQKELNLWLSSEALGNFKTGKTQFSYILWVTAQLSIGNGDWYGKFNFIDTENTFRYKRKRKFQNDSILNKIKFRQYFGCNIYIFEHFNHLILFTASMMYDDDMIIMF